MPAKAEKSPLFIEVEELKNRKYGSLIEDLSESSNEIIGDLEAYAKQEVAVYLDSRYDSEFIFAQRGDKRNPLIVRLVLDLVVFYLYERTNSIEMPLSLKDRIEENKELLKGLSNGTLALNSLPKRAIEDPLKPQTTAFRGASVSRFNDASYLD